VTRVPQTLRAELEAAIEDAIAVLDLLDGDPDTEPEPLEASGDEDEQLPRCIPRLVWRSDGNGGTERSM
jgi:hypothetical protein